MYTDYVFLKLCLWRKRVILMVHDEKPGSCQESGCPVALRSFLPLLVMMAMPIRMHHCSAVFFQLLEQIWVRRPQRAD